MGKKGKKLLSAITAARAVDPKRLFQGLPKPKKNDDGSCSCGCCEEPDAGPCPKYYQGANKRCAICDHSILCHRRKGEPPPKDWNAPRRMPVPRIDLLPPSAKTCPACKVIMLRCPICRQFTPIKNIDSGYHIGKCPTCGYFDVACPKGSQ